MDRDKFPPIIGAALLVAGIIIVILVFAQAMAMVTNVGDYFREQFPEEEGGEEEAEGPTAAFSWNTNELDVNFQDESEEGDSPIRHWDWSFGDGSSSNQQNPSHTYNSDGDYRISLRVEDQNGETDSINSEVYVEWGNYDNGRTDEEFGGDFSFEFGMGNILLPIAAALLVGIMFIVMFLVGAAMIKAGWNLIKPGPSTLKLKIKPKKLEVENAHPEPAYAQQPSHTPKPAYSQPEPAYAPQPTPDAVIASMRALPANQPQQQTYQAQGNPGYYEQQSYASPGPEQPIPQNPIPPRPSFDSSPPPPTEDNSPHPDQTNLGAYPANPPSEEPEPTPPAPEAPKPEPSSQKTEVARDVKSSSQSHNSKRAQQPQRQAGQPPRRNNSQRPRQQQKRGAPRSQNKRGGSSKSKKGKGRKKR
jgi:PKD repeat protein